MISEEKEAIEELKILKEDYWEDDGYGYATAECQEAITAIDMAIEALKQQPCDDCISRQAVLSYIYNDLGLGDEENGNDVERQMELESSYRYIKSLPSVTLKEKTGRWIQQPRCEGDEQPDLVCPNCGFKISWWDMGNFCAKCGTRLEGGAE